MEKFNFYDTLIDDDNHIAFFEIVLLIFGVTITFIGVSGLATIAIFERSAQRQFDEHLCRLRDYQIRDPACYLKGRLLGVKTQMDWKEYFSAPAPLTATAANKQQQPNLPPLLQTPPLPPPALLPSPQLKDKTDSLKRLL